MGQFVLGLRSLAVKLAVFFVLAALLAWVLGGTLWPRPHTTDSRSLTFAGKSWSWRLTIHPHSADDMRWQLLRHDQAREGRAAEVSEAWREIAGPVIVDARMIFAGRGDDGRWQLMIMNDSESIESRFMPDRLAVEQQLARIQAGLPVQDEATILGQRGIVIDPGQAQPMNADTASR